MFPSPSQALKWAFRIMAESPLQSSADYNKTRAGYGGTSPLERHAMASMMVGAITKQINVPEAHYMLYRWGKNPLSLPAVVEWLVREAALTGPEKQRAAFKIVQRHCGVKIGLHTIRRDARTSMESLEQMVNQCEDCLQKLQDNILAETDNYLVEHGLKLD